MYVWNPSGILRETDRQADRPTDPFIPIAAVISQQIVFTHRMP